MSTQKSCNISEMMNGMKIEITDKEFSELLDDHLSHLGELFRKAHTEGLDKMFDEPKHLSGDFIKSVRQHRKSNQTKMR